jgi:hypothetical protein
MVLRVTMAWRLVLLGAAATAGCAVPMGMRRYVGRLDGCDAYLGGSSHVALLRQGDKVTFSGDASAATIAGRLGPGGTLALSRPGVAGSGSAPFSIEVTGTVTDAEAKVTYITPHCRAQGVLTSE